jgi:hypothetical protein
MIKLLAIILLLPALSSFAPVPPTLYRVRLAINATPAQQACTFETAPAKLSAPIFDPIGYPFGQVTAWSCSGDGLAVARELAERAAAMQSEAAAYRAAHPIAGVR